MVVEFERHQPERRRRALSSGVCCGCCCCCCCLHSLGGVIGAAATTMMSRRQSEKGPVAATFWGLFVLACLVAVGVLSIQGGEMAGGALAVLIFLPAVQLGALVLTAVAIFMFPATFADRRASLRSLGAIGSWSFVGAVLGVVAMVLIGTASR